MRFSRPVSAVALAAVLTFSACGVPPGPHVRVVSVRVAPPAPRRTRPANPTRRREHLALVRWYRTLALRAWLAGVVAQAEKACGGNLPPCYVCWRESRCTWTAFNPTGCSGRSCYGKWQFDPRTWNTEVRAMGRLDLVGEYFPRDPLDQNAVAAIVWNGGRGCSNWNACA